VKLISWDELEKAPHIVKWVYLCSLTNHPISSSMHKRALDEHPEYFPKEVEWRNKWNAIPQEVHDDYHKEYWAAHKEAYKDLPSSGHGFYAWIEEIEVEKIPEGSKTYEECEAEFAPISKAIHDKYYKKYGIKYRK
jgi:hypothetical protein